MCLKPAACVLILLLLILITTTAQQKYHVEVLSQEFIFQEAPFKQCHASTLVENGKGDILAAWFGGDYEGADDVCIWSAIKAHGQWSQPVKTICGSNNTLPPIPCWNPVLFNPGDPTIYLYYKQGPSPREWSGMVVTSSDQGQSWSKPIALNPNLGPIKNKPLITPSETWLNPSSTETTNRWQVFIERSDDHGKTWTLIPVDTANPAKVIQPALIVLPDGTIQALCRSNQNFIMESFSEDDGLSWTSLQKTSIPNPNSGIDALTLKNGLQLLVANPDTSGKDWWNGRNRLSISVSEDGKTWTEVFRAEDQPTGEFSYPAVIQASDDVVHISYTYNRTSIKHLALKIENL
ncbi:MAG TPA: sialidase [Bacteroidales bacterium]|nr:MAG: hypothetical protein A2X11_13590 [Bacteroidetes bacterium GWE2_42_24]OFY26702.1 MAG: hypothetical protein A2X09_09840 [Bacteroidetes bacterium GWF2_43_11]HAQ64804.1 sialidase [Bacteroidales bacterium]HBZ67959.1 sialidase [Bacteroidales bacterium]